MTLERLQALRKELTRHDYRYYVLNQPEISDPTYDMLYKKYEAGLVGLIGQDTHSQEWRKGYPQWVQEEFKDHKPLA